MEQLICRTCLKANLSKTNCIQIFKKTEPTQMAMKDMLEIFMPEMDLEISKEETVICLSCFDSLKKAYFFKNVCLKTEEKIYSYLHQYNIKLGNKIALSDIIDHKVENFYFGTETSIKHSETQNLAKDNSNKLSQEDSSGSDDPNSSVFNHSRDGLLTQADWEANNVEKKEATSSNKKRKRKGMNKKTKTTNDYYNSLKRSYTCDLCEYKAYRSDLLDTHKQKHERNMLNVKVYKCHYCMYSTPRKRALDRHLFTHKGKSQHLCDFCNKPFAEKYQLKLHRITHTGQELPHKCGECGKGYLTKSYLKQHMEIRHHLVKEKEKNKNCLECNQSGKCEHLFSRCYKCSMCESSFSDKRGLCAHKFTHTGGELPYKCLHCNFSTAWKGNLKKHLQNKH